MDRQITAARIFRLVPPDEVRNRVSQSALAVFRIERARWRLNTSGCCASDDGESGDSGAAYLATRRGPQPPLSVGPELAACRGA